MSGDADAGFIPVACLNTFTQDWAIKVRVTKKHPKRDWKNDRGQGTLLSIDLLDRGDCQIQATFFNDAAHKFDEILQEGKVYRMGGG